MVISLIKSLGCLSFFLLLWTFPLFRSKCISLFNRIEQFLQKNRKLVLFSTLGLYILITLILQTHHGIEGDEGQAWLISRDTRSLGEMYSLMGYEGSPGLWHTILLPFTKFGAPYATIYYINHFFAITAIAIWLFYAPFPLFVRILLPFSHVLLTEYSIIARSYALSTCLLFTSLALYKNCYKKWLTWAVSFFLLANTNIHSTLLCCGFALFLFLNWAIRKNKTDGKAMLVIGLGILLAAIQVYPPKDLEVHLAAIEYQGSLTTILTSVVTGYTPLCVLLYFVFLLQVMIVIKDKFNLYALIAVQLALFFLLAFKHVGEMRHHFFLFFSILTSLWIGIKDRYKEMAHLLLFAILILMATASIPMAARNWKRDHTFKKEMAMYIIDTIKLDSTTFIASHPDNLPTSLLPYIPYKFFYMPDDERWGSFVIWTQKRKSGLFNAEIVQNVADLPNKFKNYQRHFYITIYELPADSINYYHIKLLKKVTDPYLVSIANSWGTYYLYQLPADKDELIK